MPISRSAIPAISLPQETLAVEPLGGEVIVRGMDMQQMLRFTATRRRLVELLPGENEAQAAERASGELVPLVLAMCVLADDEQPVYTAAQWAAFGARHPAVTMDLWDAAIRLSGQAGDHEKKA